jgi:2-dehydro-3-deoxyphosphogluconate aldolase/(4S)-4-hydroxy-2-oxoglutarate aldolase
MDPDSTVPARTPLTAGGEPYPPDEGGEPRTVSVLRERLRRHRLVAIIRGDDPHAVTRTAVTLVECGIPLVEVSLTGAHALTALRDAVRDIGQHGLVGAGTVITEDDAERAAEAGAAFVVTPGLGPGADRAAVLGLPALIGALTPTEVGRAQAAANCAAVKLFPASLGGAPYLAALRQPFPHTPFVPVGGIGPAEAQAMLAAGALAIGAGSPLIGDAAAGGPLTALKGRAAAFLEAVGDSQ